MSDLNIIDKIAHYIERFVFVRPQCIYQLIAVWVIGTYLHANFDHFGYLYFWSAKEQCGKTRMLEVLATITFSPSPIIVAPTSAGLYRGIAGHTQLLDELDSIENLETLRSVLNAGFSNGGVVTRHDGEEHRRAVYPVFAPRAMAGIGSGIFHQTTLDRMFLIQMLPQTPQEKRERFRLRTIKNEAEMLRKEIEVWAAENGGQVVAQYNHAQFTYLERFRDRTQDITEPLAAILETVYAARPDLQKARLSLLDAIAILRKEQESASADYRLLMEIIGIAGDGAELMGSASELAARLGDSRNGREWAISELLRRYGFVAKSKRIAGGMPQKRYVLRVVELRDLSDRLAPRCSSKEDEK